MSAIEAASAGSLAVRDLLGVELSEASLQLALTHRSFAFENGNVPHNERLEFLGDAVLGQAVTVKLYRDFPELPEGELAKRRASVVSSVALAGVARSLGLGAHIRLGRGEAQSGGGDKASILADTLEALIGASFLDCGPEAAEALVLRLVGPLIDDPNRSLAALDPKTSLQEYAARHRLAPPNYQLSETGPDHDKRYRARVTVGSQSGEGEGTSKKTAEMAAALDAWSKLAD